MAIHMALNGGLGVIHHNCPVATQAAMVRKVKLFENGFITEPMCMGPQNTVADVMEIKRRYGFCGIPITADGRMNSRLLGIVTSRDIDFLQGREPQSIPLSDVMTTNLTTAKVGVSLAEGGLLRRSLLLALCRII